QLSYAQLNSQANQLAHYLIDVRQNKPDKLVGIVVERSLSMVVGILAILKAGGAYVPLDPGLPQARLAFMLEDAGLSTVLIPNHLRVETPVSQAQAVCFADKPMQGELAKQSSANPQQVNITPDHLAYVIYTSGSTGQPKGVLIEHASVLNLAFNLQTLDLCHPPGCWGWFASFSFDASVQGLTQLAFGHRLEIITEKQKRDPLLLTDSLSQLSVIDCTPMMVESWLSSGLGAQLPNLIIGGEAISPQLWSALCEWQEKYHKKAINVYGPTECTVDSHWCLITGETPHIGKVLSNVQAFVLNEAGALAVPGVSGELHIGGPGLARSYLNQPELTAQKFINNPFYNKDDLNSSERLYKTGDLVRYLPDGNLAFIGRIDHQVKIRGFRIELGEIENTLAGHPQVKDVLLMVNDTAGDKRLVAYVVTDTPPSEAQQALSAQLREYLNDTLPEYMIPSAFVLLDQLPLTANGKVDRKALPEPDMTGQQAVYVAPGTDIEKTVCDIWQHVLGIAQLGLNDHFFELGGHSLLAMKMVALAGQKLNINIPVKVLFDAPVLAGFSATLLQLEGAAYPAIVKCARDEALLSSYAQQRLWLIDQIDGASAHYNIPGGFHLAGELNLDALNSAFATIIERHESLRTRFVQNDDGQLIQVIQHGADFELPLTDYSALAVGERDNALAQSVTQEAGREFDLSQDLMIRGQLIKLATDQYVLLVTMHHIAADGWSMSILINELSALYSAYSQGEDNPLAALGIQYADYAHWQRSGLVGEVLTSQMDYWTTQL
ncbi:MAG: amino acid adenylation domain-containing protein, partial [Algicola sp.]|nr:amino acid adenylation domain-containing protein [Algicola sp.]